MDFAGTEPWLRTVAFSGVFVGAAVLAWWVLSISDAGSLRQVGASLGALAAIPAAMVAPFQEGSALTLLGFLSVAGFAVAVAAAATPLFAARRTHSLEGGVAAAPSAPGGPAKPRVATYRSATEVRPGRAAEHTVSLHRKSSIAEIAFLVDYSADGHPYRLEALNRIGRDPAAEITVDDDGASREHARVSLEDRRFVVLDLGSTNGTHLVREGRRRTLDGPAILQDLDTIEIGEARLVFISVELPSR